MQDELDIFERQIKDAIQDAEVTPPSGMWKRVRRSLDEREPARRDHWAWAGVSFAIVAVAAVAFVLFLPHYNGNEAVKTQASTGASLTAEVRNKPVQENAVVDENTTSSERSAAIVESNTVIKKIASEEKTEDSVFIEQNTPSSDNPSQNLLALNTTEEEVGQSKADNTVQTYEDPFAAMEMEDRLAAQKKASSGVSISADGSIVGNMAAGNGRRRQSRAQTPQTGKVLSPGVYEDGASTYGIPLTFGLGIKYNLGNNFAIGSGIDYSYLTRNFKGVYLPEASSTGEEGIEGNVHHQMHYLGIPVTVFYNIVTGEKFHLYVLGTGEAEYCLSSSYTITAESGIYNYKEKVNGLQFSVGLGFGAELMLSKNISLFLDPSARYYFPGQQPKSIRTDKQFTVGADLGFRYQF